MQASQQAIDVFGDNNERYRPSPKYEAGKSRLVYGIHCFHRTAMCGIVCPTFLFSDALSRQLSFDFPFPILIHSINYSVLAIVVADNT